MNDAITQMLAAYDVRDLYDRKNAMKEIMQEIVLCGLSRAGVFKRAAFYCGFFTAWIAFRRIWIFRWSRWMLILI